MTSLLGPLLFVGVGATVLAWAFEAHRRWLDAMARRGELPMGGTELMKRGWLDPRAATNALVAASRAMYPRATASTFDDVELWRIRRGRRFLMALAWLILGGPLAILVLVVAEGDESGWSLLLLAGLTAIIGFFGLLGYRFGMHEQDGRPR